MILNYSNYRHFLKGELAERATKNPSYSLRAFAKQIGISPAYLSLILSGKKNLASSSALKIANKLNLSTTETEYFVLMVQFEYENEESIKCQLLDRMNSLNKQRKTTDLSLDVFRIISDWYHYGILMLTEINDFEFTPQNVASRLGINRFEAEAAIARLQQLELLEPVPNQTKKFRRIKGDLMVNSPAPNQALRKYHKQLLERASESLETQTPQERLIGSEFIAISKGQLDEANQIMEEFFQKMIRLSKQKNKKTDVYHVGVQIFNLTKERGRK